MYVIVNELLEQVHLDWLDCFCEILARNYAPGAAAPGTAAPGA